MMTSKYLMTVEGAVDARRRGALVWPGPSEDEWESAGSWEGELRLPNGEVSTVSIEICMVLGVGPPPDEFRYGVIVKGVSAREIPVGSELWCRVSESDPPANP